MGTRQPAARKRGIRLVSHTTDISTEGIVCSAVSPRVTEWVPELLAKLRPQTERTIRKHRTTDPWRTSSQLLSEILPAWKNTEEPWTDNVAEAVGYARAITTLALSYQDEPSSTLNSYHQQRHADLIDTVTSIGTGRGSVNADLGALAKGPVALHRELKDHPTVLTLLLDGDTWTSLTDRRTGVHALAAIAVLADGFDVRLVVSPSVQRHLSKRYPNWSECHLDLTASRDRSPHTDYTTQTAEAAWEAIRDLDTEPGKRRLLGNINVEDARSYRGLTNDHTIDIADGSISRYVLDLEARDLVAIDRRGKHNTVQLTDLGQLAVQQCLDDRHDLVHPDQCRLGRSLTATPQQSTSTVSPRRAGEETPTPDEWVAATGDPNKSREYVKWLTGPGDAPNHLHERFSTVTYDDAITLVDDQLHPFEDGRVAYLSHTNGETLVVLQWGGPLATLGRLASALLSEKALSKLLTPSRLGHEFDKLHEDVNHDTARILRRGHQVGWYSHTETTYGAWRERITTVRNNLLAQVAELTNSDDTAARSELFEDLHGLIASATQLYHAAGIDLTTTIRVPDTDALARNTIQLHELCEFLAKTVPKQSVYGIHAGYRMLFEDRPEKLCRRLPYEMDQDTTMDLTMSWVVTGPTITALHDDIAATLSREFKTVREAIADGTEQAPPLEIPVVNGTTYTAIRRVIDEIAMTHDVQWIPRERQRLVRLCLHSFGPADTRSSCPYDVVESLLRALSESHAPTPADVERAAATLSATRFRPDLTPTATKLYATLLRAEQPLGRSELVERAGISASSYDRRIQDVRELEQIQAVQMDGHRRWTTDHGYTTKRSAAVNKPPTPLLAHRQTNPSHRVVSSHPDTWAQQRSTHAYTDLLTSTQTMPKDTTLPVKTHWRSIHHDVQHAAQPSQPTSQDPHDDQTSESPTIPTFHPNRGGETK